jgi:hypothetical protein
MRPIATILAGLLLAGPAAAGDVYVTKDAQGNNVYTDTPQTVPAQRVEVRTGVTDTSTATERYSAEMAQHANDEQAYAKSQAQESAARQAAQTTAEDKAQRCTEARQRYQTLMNNWRVYEQGPNGERTYLTSEQIDQARANAKQVMDQFCSDQ